jgi:HK97 gp10 family phage protein
MARSVSVDGLSKLQRNVHQIVDKAQGEAVMTVLGRAANQFRRQAIANAESEGLPKEVADSIFAYGRLTKVRKNPSALVGIKRGPGSPSYVEWVAHTPTGTRSAQGTGRTINAKAEPGKVIGMSLASMFEYGTSKMPPRPYFARALKEKRPEVRAFVREELLKVLTRVE